MVEVNTWVIEVGWLVKIVEVLKLFDMVCDFRTDCIDALAFGFEIIPDVLYCLIEVFLVLVYSFTCLSPCFRTEIQRC